MLDIIVNGYRRINKSQAKKYYSKGATVYLLPCKVNPNSLWVQMIPISSKLNEGAIFQNVLNEFEYYNCNPVLGNYASFFIKE